MLSARMRLHCQITRVTVTEEGENRKREKVTGRTRERKTRRKKEIEKSRKVTKERSGPIKVGRDVT